MKFRHFSTLFASFFALALLALGTFSAHAEDFFYRYSTPPSVTCTTSGIYAQIQLGVGMQEYNLPPGATLTIYLIFNGVAVLNSTGVATPSGTGTNSVGFFNINNTTFPFSTGLRLDTVIGGQVVYRSTIIFSCASDGAYGVATITNGVPGAGGGIGGINDGRINSQNFAPVALYCKGSILTAYAINSTGEGTLAWEYNFAASGDALPNKLGIALLHSPDVRFSVLAPQRDGKQYLFVFDGCPYPGALETYISDPATGQFVRTE